MHIYSKQSYFSMCIFWLTQNIPQSWGGNVWEKGGMIISWPSLWVLGSKPQSLTLIDAKKLTKAISDWSNSLQNWKHIHLTLLHKKIIKSNFKCKAWENVIYNLLQFHTQNNAIHPWPTLRSFNSDKTESNWNSSIYLRTGLKLQTAKWVCKVVPK